MLMGPFPGFALVQCRASVVYGQRVCFTLYPCSAGVPLSPSGNSQSLVTLTPLNNSRTLKIGTHDSSVSSETSLRHCLKFREKPAKEEGPGDSSGDRDSEVPTIIFYKNFQFLSLAIIT